MPRLNENVIDFSNWIYTTRLVLPGTKSRFFSKNKEINNMCNFLKAVIKFFNNHKGYFLCAFLVVFSLFSCPKDNNVSLLLR